MDTGIAGILRTVFAASWQRCGKLSGTGVVRVMLLQPQHFERLVPSRTLDIKFFLPRAIFLVWYSHPMKAMYGPTPSSMLLCVCVFVRPSVRRLCVSVCENVLCLDIFGHLWLNLISILPTTSWLDCSHKSTCQNALECPLSFLTLEILRHI